MTHAMPAHKSAPVSASKAKPAFDSLRVGEPNDAFEREADRVADQVMATETPRMDWSLTKMSIGSGLQRKCACGGFGQCAECAENQTVQPKGDGTIVGDDAPPMVREVLSSSGSPLDQATRSFFEPRFGHDFGNVRVHADRRAVESARSVGALAYTVGSHVAFGDRRYRPTTPVGRTLLAHELAHVVQQSRGGSSGRSDVGALEAAADRAAEAAALPHAHAVNVEGRSGIGLFRQTTDPLITATGRIKAMTPEDMYNKVIAMRGFDESVPVAKLDEVKNQLAQMEAQLKSNPSPELRRQYNKLLSQYNISTFEGAGGAAGQGYNTYALVQVVDKDGNIIAVADGKFTGGLHAEQIALNKIKAQLGDQKIPGARVEVVGDRTVCADVCVPAFEQFAEKYEVGKVDGHVFRRSKAVGSGLATEKYTARTATAKVSEGRTPVRESKTIVSRSTGGGGTLAPAKSGGSGPRPVGQIEAEGATGAPRTGSGQAGLQRGVSGGQAQPQVRTGGNVGEINPRARTGLGAEAEVKPRVSVSGTPEVEGTPRARVAGQAEEETSTPRLGGAVRNVEAGESVLGGAVKSAAKGAAKMIGTGIAMSILQEEFREKVLADLAALPKPQVDKRSARAYLGDPKTQSGMRALDVLNKNLGPFSKELEDEQTKISASRFTQLMATALLPEKTTEQYEKKIQQIDAIQQDLDAWEQELLTVDSNLDALLGLEGQLNETAKAAQDLKRFFSIAGVADELLKMGFSYEEWEQLISNLGNISDSIARTLADARKAKETVRKLINETADFSHQVNQLWWQEFGGQVGKLIKDKDEARRQAQERSMLKTKVKYGSLEGFDPLPLFNSDQLGMWSFYKTREGEILFQLNELTKGGPAGQDTHDRKVELEADLANVRQKMLEMRRGATAP